jgi:threonyl-tRNA synthetase
MCSRIHSGVFLVIKNKITNCMEEHDHRRIGQELDLFTFSDLVGSGLPLWTPRGTMVRTELDKFVWELRSKFEYQRVTIPHITKRDLYERSGHWEKFSDDLFRIKSREGREYAIKPMNCPNAMTIFKYKTRSYNDLPMKLGETTTLHRFELSGTLNGLFRTRMFRQDDAHIFMKQDQVKQVFTELMQMIDEMYSPFGLSYRLRFGTRPESFLGESADRDEVVTRHP